MLIYKESSRKKGRIQTRSIEEGFTEELPFVFTLKRCCHKPNGDNNANIRVIMRIKEEFIPQ